MARIQSFLINYLSSLLGEVPNDECGLIITRDINTEKTLHTAFGDAVQLGITIEHVMKKEKVIKAIILTAVHQMLVNEQENEMNKDFINEIKKIK